MLQQRRLDAIGARAVFDARAVQGIRSRKAKVGDWVRRRISDFGLGSIPVDVDPRHTFISWWADWEVEEHSLPSAYVARQLIRKTGSRKRLKPNRMKFERPIVELPDWMGAAVS